MGVLVDFLNLSLGGGTVESFVVSAAIVLAGGYVLVEAKSRYDAHGEE